MHPRAKKAKHNHRKTRKPIETVDYLKSLLFSYVGVTYQESTDDFIVDLKGSMDGTYFGIKGYLKAEELDTGVRIKTPNHLLQKGNTLRLLYLANKHAPNLRAIIKGYVDTVGDLIDADESTDVMLEIKPLLAIPDDQLSVSTLKPLKPLIQDSGLPKVTIKALTTQGYSTLNELAGLSDDELLAIPIIGPSRLKAIRREVEKWQAL